jgi:hypothetical protein
MLILSCCGEAEAKVVPDEVAVISKPLCLQSLAEWYKEEFQGSPSTVHFTSTKLSENDFAILLKVPKSVVLVMQAELGKLRTDEIRRHS